MRHQFCSSASRFYYFCFISDEFHASSSDMLMLVLTSYISWLEKQLVGENRVRRAIFLQYKSVFVWNNSDFINLRLLCVHEHTNKFSNHKKTVVTNKYWCINDTNLTVNLLIDESIDGQWILCDSIMFDIGFVGWFYCFFLLTCLIEPLRCRLVHLKPWFLKELRRGANVQNIENCTKTIIFKNYYFKIIVCAEFDASTTL